MDCKKEDCKECRWLLKEEDYCKRYFRAINEIIFER